MNLSGKETFPATPAEIWAILMDTDKLAAITPGLSRLEATAEDQYIAFAEVKIGPVKGVFKGEMAIIDKVEPQSFTLQVNQKSKIGNVNADVAISLAPTDAAHTELSFEGKAKMSGLLARTGARVMTGVSNTLTKQFFSGLAAELAK